VNAASGLAGFLAPVSIDDFVDRYLERLPLHVARDDASYVADLFSVAGVEEILVASAHEPARLALVRAGKPQAAAAEYTYTDPGIRAKTTGKQPRQRIDVRKVIGLFGSGYTIAISDASAVHAGLQRACNRLQNDLGAYVGANVYLTPPGAAGFDLHHDTHDILIAQIEGTKSWRIYEPATTLPLESQPLHREVEIPALRVHRDITLRPGDTLYLPRGFAHEAIAGPDRALHVSFALAPVRVIDLLQSALAAGAERNLDLRRALPFGWHKRPTFGAEFAAILAPYAALIFGREQLDAAAEGTLRDMFAASRSEAGDAFDQLRRAEALEPGTCVRLNDTIPYLLRDRPATLDILLPGKTLHLPPECRAAMSLLMRGPQRVADLLPGHTDDDRRLFVRTLAIEGLVTLD
jgi:lysine-specific demethylase/histidyl-hydroxylase NO66